ncbi:hypothetical protein PATSB16_15460 [Pandoraea thiooxydans]|nr:hypothetical protein PATSB16_15460 [Pandoraea thiooxydans]
MAGGGRRNRLRHSVFLIVTGRLSMEAVGGRRIGPTDIDQRILRARSDSCRSDCL